MPSMIDTTKPENNALILSSVIRDAFTAAKNDIEAIQNNYATKVYVDSSVVGLEDATNKVDTVIGNETSTTKYLSVKGTYDFVTTLLDDDATLAIAIGNILYFVGCFIESSVATNPATLLGFGTWELQGAVQTIVYLDASQTEIQPYTEVYRWKRTA